jgi:hypothetical protein
MDDTSSHGSTTTGPATFAEAFAADASSASTPSQSHDDTAHASADATALPVESGADGTTPATGEPPKDRWADILENARTKAREETSAEWKQYEWAKQVSQQEFQQLAQMAQKATSDPIAYMQDFIKELQTHPTYSAQLKSLAAKALSQRSAAPQEPQLVKVQLEDGSVVEMPRNPAEWLASQKQQWLAEVEQKLQPVTQTYESLKAKEAAAARQQEITSYVETTQADALTWPGMDDKANRAAVAEELKLARIDGNDPREVSLALNAAWRKVVAPKLSSNGASSLLENLQRKAAAASSVNPGSAASSAPSKVTSFFDKSLAWK